MAPRARGAWPRSGRWSAHRARIPSLAQPVVLWRTRPCRTGRAGPVRVRHAKRVHRAVDMSGQHKSSKRRSGERKVSSDAPRLGMLVKRAEQAMIRAKSAALKFVGLTPAQYVAPVELDQQPGITAATLARSCLVTSQAMMILLRPWSSRVSSAGRRIRERARATHDRCWTRGPAGSTRARRSSRLSRASVTLHRRV